MDAGKCGNGCKCVCHKMPGLLIALIGVTFLLGHFGAISEDLVSVIWPVILILIGLKKACRGICKCCAGTAK